MLRGGGNGLRKLVLGLFLMAAGWIGWTDRMAVASAAPVHCFAASDGANLCYQEAGRENSAAAILVFIPGWTMPAAIWAAQMEHFAPHYHVIAFDPRGQGHSQVARGGYTLERRVQDLHEMLEHIPGDKLILVGWSLAVLEVLSYTERYGTGRIGGLVLVDNSVGEGDAPRKRGGGFFDSLRKDREQTVKSFVRRMFATAPPPELLDTVTRSALQIGVEDSIQLLSYDKPRTYWREAVHGADRPILYAITPRWKEQAALLVRKHPRASSVVFEGAGHALFVDQAARFNRALEEFLLTF